MIPRSSPMWMVTPDFLFQRPPYRDPALHYYAPRLIALRGGDRNEETPATENQREMLMRRACARTPSPRSVSPPPLIGGDWTY